MSALVVDTSSWVSWLAGKGSPLIDEAAAEGRLYLPVMVAAELLSGKLSPKKQRELEAALRELPLCAQDVDHWFRVGRLRAFLRAVGLTTSTPDAHVAQSALDLDAQLLTEDAVFAKVARHTELRLAGR